MRYNTKSLIICRNKDRRKTASPEFPYYVMVKLFNVNDPHLTPEVPNEVLEFNKVQDVVLKNQQVKYMPLGSDIILNDLETVKITKVNGQVIIE